MSSQSMRPLKPRTRRAAAVARKAPAKAAKAERSRLELETLQAFRTIFASARRHDAEVRTLARISGSQLWALSEVARGAGMRVNDLSEVMALHQTTTSNLVNVLVDRKLIKRGRDVDDQRVVRLHVTTEGKRLLLQAPGPYAGLLVDALRHLKAAELARLRVCLSSITRILRDAPVDAAGETLMGE